MLIYALNAFSLPVYEVCFKKKRIIYIVIGLQMFLIMALRYKYLGVDLEGYEAAFIDVNAWSFQKLISELGFIQTVRINLISSMESGYVILNWLIGHVGFGYHSFLVICSAINMISVGYFFYKYSKSPCLSYIMFIAAGPYYYCFGILRQCLAMSILLFSVPLILKKKYVKTMILILLAFLFHRSAACFILLIPLSRIKMTKNTYIATFLIGIISFFAMPYFIQRYFFPLLRFIGKPSYTLSMELNVSNLLIALVITSILILINGKFKMYEDSGNNLMCWAFLVYLISMSIGSYVITGNRFSTVFLVMTSVLIPNIIMEFKDRSTKYLLSGVLYMFFFAYMIHFYIGSAIVPYVSMFSG